MGFGGISIWQLLIILAIVILLFGTKRLRNIGGDLGSALKGFRSAMRDEDKPDAELEEDEDETDTATSEQVEHEPQGDGDKKQD